MGRNRDAIKSFEVLDEAVSPMTRYIPTDSEERKKLYDKFKKAGIALPAYSSINRANMEKEDLRVLCEDWHIKFKYKSEVCKLTLLKGYIWDGASIPSFLVIGRLTKNGQHIQIPAMVHDILFNQHLLPFMDCNNVFRGLLNSNKNANTTKRRYTLGVRSMFGKKSYKKNNPAISWMTDYYVWSEKL